MDPRFQYLYKSSIKRAFFFCIDVLGFIFVFPIRWVFQKPRPLKIQKILAIRIDHLGDAVMIRPALSALKSRYPNAELDVLVAPESKALLSSDIYINKIHVFNNNWFSRGVSWWKPYFESLGIIKALKKEKYDLCIDFRGDLRIIVMMSLMRIPIRLAWGQTGGSFLLSNWQTFPDKQHQISKNLKLLRPLNVDSQFKRVPFKYSDESKRKFYEYIDSNLDLIKDIKIVVHPEAGYPSKQWGEQKYKLLIEQLLNSARQYHVFILGTDNTSSQFYYGEQPRLHDLRGKTKIEDLPVLFDACDLLIGNDSGPAHIAASQNMKSIILFSGTNEPAYWKPWSDYAVILNESVPCAPCEAKVCPLKHHDCMEKIALETVFETVENILTTDCRV